MKKVIGLILTIILGTTICFGQSMNRKGQVKDGLGNLLPGVSIFIEKNNKNGTSTDVNGEFSISAEANEILVISFIGMKEQRIKVGDKTYFNIVLLEDRISVDEVIVTGIGTKKRNEFTGSVTTVGKEKLAQIPMPSVEQVLQGNVAGLNSVSLSGQPGAAQDIKIRGIGSMSASNAPLYVIDGIPVVSGDYSNNATSSNVMAGISSNDIASINILKDASATSVYGARGANGVIVITTKRGKQGKTSFSFDAEYGFNSIAVNEQKTLDAKQWQELLFEGLSNGEYGHLIGGQFKDPKDLWENGFRKKSWDGKTNTNWNDAILRDKAIQQQYNISVRGGNNKTNFFTSVGYFNQEGVVKNSDYSRISGLLNLNHRATEKITLQTSLNLSHSKQHTLPDGGYFANPMMARFFCLSADKAYNDDGSTYLPEGGRLMNNLFNPVYLLEKNFKKNLTTKVLGNAQLFYRPIENMKYTCKIGLDYMNLEESEYQNPIHGDARLVNGRSYAYYTRNFNWVFQNMLDYHLQINDDNKMDLKFLHEVQQNKYFSMSAMAERTAKSGLYYLNSFAAPKSATSSFGTWTSASVMMNMNYAYKKSLYLDGTFRREGSSKFSADNKYGNFWSLGASFNFVEGLNNETINSIFDELRLRTSYGVNGNAGIGSNLYLSLISYSGSYNDDPATFRSGLINNNLKWEKNSPFNVGLDFKLLDKRISGTVEYFYRKTSDLLMAVPISKVSGNSSIMKNVGEMVNKGYEITLSTKNLNGEFSWDTDINFTTIDNKVTKLYKDQSGKEVILNYTSTTIREGENINTWYLKEWAGVDPDNGDALWYTNDGRKNADGSKKTTADYNIAKQTLIGSSTPKIYGGITNTFAYKGFSLSAQINYSLGYKIMDSWANYFLSDGAYTANYGGYSELMDRWQKPGDIASNPKNVWNNKSSSNKVSSRFLYNGDHLRLRNITLGYNIPKSLLKSCKINSCNVYVRGTNLYTYKFDKDLNFDPEVPTGGSISLRLPIMKTITFGIKVNF